MTKSSPLINMKNIPQQQVSMAPVVSTRNSPLAHLQNNEHQKKTNSLLLTQQNIEDLGKDIPEKVREISNQILDLTTLSNNGELGVTLSLIKAETEKMDPSKSLTSFTGRIHKFIGNTAAFLIQQYQTSKDVFDGIEKKLKDEIKNHEQSIIMLENLQKENIEHRRLLIEVIQKGSEYQKYIDIYLANFPEIKNDDPDAMIKADELHMAKSLSNRMSRRLENFEKSKVIIEISAQTIRNEQDTSENTIQTLRDILDHTIPAIRRGFSIYIKSLENAKTQKDIDNFKTFANNMLRVASDQSTNTAIKAAQNNNKAIITTDTLNYMQEKSIEVITSLDKIVTDAKQRREQDTEKMRLSQNNYLLTLQSHYNQAK